MGSRLPRNFTSPVRARAQDGFTLVEILVSSLIIVLIAAGVAQALIASTHFSGSQREHSQADQVAQQDQERMKGMPTSSSMRSIRPGRSPSTTAPSPSTPPPRS
jgi:prepilin-type N-terminal cleavage/methylation domain-containing protein